MRLPRGLATPLVGLSGGWLASLVGWPLPWLVGAMLAVILVRCSGWRIEDIPNGRRCGQWIISSAIGLHFTREVVGQVSEHALIILVCALGTLFMSIIGVVIFRRGGDDPVTAFFSSMPGGASEMINLASRHRAGRLDRVAAAQSLRMVLLVLTIPAIFTLGIDAPSQPAALPVEGVWLALLLPLGALVALGWQRLQQPNPWMLGPLFVCATFAVALDRQVGLPPGLGEAGQWLMGCSLGCHFDRPFFRSAPAFLIRVVAFTVLMVLGTSAMAWGLAVLGGLPVPAVMLGMMPGGISELSLTAEALNLSVALVTAIQVLRFVLVLFLAERVFRFWQRCRLRDDGV